MLFARVKKALVERRTSPRRPSRLQVRCCVKSVTERGPWMAALKEITRDGISLVIDRPFKPGMVLGMRIPVAHGVRCLKFVHVCQCLRQAGTRDWLVRGVFRPSLTPEEFNALVTLPIQETQVSPIIHVIQEGPWWASIRDVSATGLGLIVEQPFKSNALLTVQLPEQGETLGPPTLLRVVHARRKPGCPWWILGCAFLKRISPMRQRALL
jgi:hypothetical protein